MKAVIKINEDMIKRAIKQYFVEREASRVELKASPVEDHYGHSLGHTISAEVEIEVGDIVAA